MPRPRPLDRLEGAQLAASDPRANVWLSASAGTGKTHVLTARVLRLLLAGVDPAAILCLTFTKAGAAEMAERIHRRLAEWVRMRPPELRRELFALGERNDDAAVALARTLFARVLEAAGGGLRIQTIHAFCQTLLAAFPAEAGLAPGFRPIEGREEAALARRVLAELLVDAEAGGDLGLIDDVARLSRRLGEQGAETYLVACARDPEALAALGSREGIEARLRHALEVPLGDVDAAIASACEDGSFDCDLLRELAAANAGWGAKTGLDHADCIGTFLGADPAVRATMLDLLAGVAVTRSGDPRKPSAKLLALQPDYAELAARLGDSCATLLSLRARAELVALLAAGLRGGQAYARAYAEAKRAGGLVDFDDLIRTTVRLLATDGIGDWIRYKLDQATDHLLIDEAQDTNARQWSIVAALASDYFAGEGAKGRRRTIFTVGDFKQAIFGFQGTDPAAFAAARGYFERQAEAARRPFQRLALGQSFRSTPPVLELVDRLLAEIGGDGLGVTDAFEAHLSAKGGPGTVTLLRPFVAAAAGEAEEGEEGWIDDVARAYATRLARQIAAWLESGLMLESRGRALRPEDVLVLVRKRGALASLLVARLHAEGVPVAGVDRLRLDAPLAVRDLLAALRFAVQPGDDLNLAALLVSPLFGWEQDRLYRVGFRRTGSLWSAVRDVDAETAATLGALLAGADFSTPHRFLERILSGPMQGRRRLLARLGEEARDPIEELVSAALAFEAEQAPSLQRFIDWFDRGEVEIKRDPAAPLDAVRVMTVHGAKGLQAPLVILADATADPDQTRARPIAWEVADGARVPVFAPRKEERAGSLAEAHAAQARLEREEHWRLLYVAATRAEERLVVAGALGVRQRAKGVAPEASWHAAIDRALAGLGAVWVEDALWSGARHHRGGEARPRRAERARRAPPEFMRPDWLDRPAPAEARPPRPLAPSAVGVTEVAEPPAGSDARATMARGALLHALFERLPAMAPERRAAAAAHWLEWSAGVTDAGVRDALVADACRVVGDPAFADVFAADALAEVPLAAVVGGQVIAGTVDRLRVSDEAVRFVDFKTGRRVPADAASVPAAHLAQMAAYAAALAAVFPGRRIEAGLLYTAAPRLIALPQALLDAHKPGYAAAEQKPGEGG